MDEFVLLKLVNLSISSLFIVGAWCARKFIGAWLNPASIFFLFWFFYTAFPLVVAFEAPVNPFALIYILAFCFMFMLPSLLLNWPAAFAANSRKLSAHHYFDRPLIALAFYLIVCSSVILIFIGVLEQGISIDQVIQNPIAIGGVYAGKRYSGDIVSSLYAQLGLQCSYYAAVLGGLLYGSRAASGSQAKLLFLSFLPALLVMFLQSAKGLFFFSIFIFIGGVLVTRIYNKNFALLDARGLRKLCSYGVLVLPLVIASFLSRGIYQLDDATLIFSKLRYYLVTYSSVHLPAFSDWFSERYFDQSSMNYRQEYLTSGFYTFMSLFQMLGDQRYVPMGTYDEFYTCGEYVKGNLFTVFRGLVTDFGLFGSLVFALLAGWICSIGFKRLLVREQSSFAIVFFIFFVAISYQTYLTSTLTWLTIPLVFCVQWAMLACLMKLKIR